MQFSLALKFGALNLHYHLFQKSFLISLAFSGTAPGFKPTYLQVPDISLLLMFFAIGQWQRS